MFLFVLVGIFFVVCFFSVLLRGRKRALVHWECSVVLNWSLFDWIIWWLMLTFLDLYIYTVIDRFFGPFFSFFCTQNFLCHFKVSIQFKQKTAAMFCIHSLSIFMMGKHTGISRTHFLWMYKIYYIYCVVRGEIYIA